jgi:pyruvate dehydrogenase E2 component (dihydrolipoamide acetyltransferase)
VLRSVATSDVLAIARARRAAVDRALGARMSADDQVTPHSTLSNLGSYGVDSFTGIVPFGQTSILTVGTAAQRPVVADGALAVGTTMHLTLNVDHREWDGQHAADALRRFAAIATEPTILLALT